MLGGINKVVYKKRSSLPTATEKVRYDQQTVNYLTFSGFAAKKKDHNNLEQTLKVIYRSVLRRNREKDTLGRELKVLTGKRKRPRRSSRPGRKTQTALHGRLPGEVRLRVPEKDVQEDTSY